ncbi:sensor domain-containing protein [Nocardia amikacinitolerans]|uniref:sensor domain-containing protein n=1 Tax=Nocardia amikacinitolerans TaxID=756689 RepID=UPI0027E2E88B|nr:sensor domain-containing protein [Nocardia amikacinitolerans]
MTVPDSWGRTRALGACVVAVCVLLLTGCGSTVTGQPVAARPSTVRHIDAALTTLLPEPAQFPARYPAVVLPPEAAAQAAGDLNGVTRGATVRPDGCAPAEQQFGPDHTAIAVGTDEVSRATLTVELTRTRQPLSTLREQVLRCGEVRVVARAGATTTVSTELDPPPPLDADDTLALRRTVAPDVGGPGLTQTMRTLIGQVGDVRISVTYMTFSDAPPDTTALDELFTASVRKVREA